MAKIPRKYLEQGIIVSHYSCVCAFYVLVPCPLRSGHHATINQRVELDPGI